VVQEKLEEEKETTVESTHLVVEYFVDFVALFMFVETYIVVRHIQKEYGSVWNM